MLNLWNMLNDLWSLLVDGSLPYMLCWIVLMELMLLRNILDVFEGFIFFDVRGLFVLDFIWEWADSLGRFGDLILLPVFRWFFIEHELIRRDDLIMLVVIDYLRILLNDGLRVGYFLRRSKLVVKNDLFVWFLRWVELHNHTLSDLLLTPNWSSCFRYVFNFGVLIFILFMLDKIQRLLKTHRWRKGRLAFTVNNLFFYYPG